MLAPHQRDAAELVLKLLQHRRAAILADDVGLGKSFVAAAVMKEWLRGHRGPLELIVPAALVPQWRETLAAFGVQAQLSTHDALAGDPVDPGPAPGLVVVDEAHAFRNPRTKRYAGLARRTAASSVLLVTATPVCNSVDDLRSIVRLVAADDLLLDCGVPSIDAAFDAGDAGTIGRIVGALVIRRDRAALGPELDFGALARSVVRHDVPALPLLDDLRFPLVEGPAIVRLFLRRRLESSCAALAESLRRQRRFYERSLSALGSGRALPKREYRRAFAHEEDQEIFQEVLFWELFAPPAAGVEARDIQKEARTVERLLEQLASIVDPKVERLVEIVRSESEPLLVFTGAAATARCLHDALGVFLRCGLVTSRTRSREAVLRDFRGGRLDAVVSTDMAAEGLNLQRAGLVVHYDLPWNPVKLDQRNGRVHRIGQTRRVVRAVYFVPVARDTGILSAVSRKNRARRRTLRATVAAPRETALPTLRPRVPAGAAVHLLVAAGVDVPPALERVHKAGVELLIAEAGRDGARGVDELVALANGGCASVSTPEEPPEGGLTFGAWTS